jgi:hypothetical protein
MVKVACSLAAALLLISSGAAYSRSQTKPTTLVWSNGPIRAFAQDGGQLAWESYNTSHHADCAEQVRIRLLGPKTQKIVNKPPGPTCNYELEFGPGVSDDEGILALAGKRALWTLSGPGDSMEIWRTYLVTASYAGTRDVGLEYLEYDETDGSDYLRGISGDSSTLVYGIVKVAESGCGGDSTSICTSWISGGGVKRVTGAHTTVAIPGAPPPFLLAASGHRVAIIVAKRDRGGIGPGSPATVVVKDAVTGADVGSFSPAGTPLGIAFAPSVVAVLESTTDGRQIEFRTPTGTLLRTAAVPAKATGLSTTNKRAVFSVGKYGKSIWTVRVAAGAVKTIGAAASAPIGLSIEGTRVAWAENVKIHGVQRGRIRAITVR